MPIFPAAHGLLVCCTMSTKSKRRIARRSENPPAQGPASKREVAGQIVGALLSAITFGAVDGPSSARGTQPSSSTPAGEAPHPA